MSKRGFGILLYRWHAWVGLFSGLFLIVICTTGTVAVFRPEIERATDLRAVKWSAVRAVGEPVGVDAAVATAEAFGGKGRRASAVRVPALAGSAHENGDTYAVTLEGGKGERAATVYVDPYRSEVIGSGVPGKGWGDIVRQLHVRFYYFGFWGRYVVGVFGIALLFSTVSGLLIYRKFNAGRWRPRVRWGRGQRIVLADLHKVIGLATVAFNVMFGATGAVLGLEGVYFKYLRETPAKVERVQAERRLGDGGIAGLMARAEELVPGTRATGAGLTYRRNGLVRVSLTHPTAALIKEDASYAVLEAASGRAVDVYDATTVSAGVRAYYASEPLHFGRLGGYLWVKLLWGLVGLSGGVLSCTGFAIYVLRKRNRAKVETRDAVGARGAIIVASSSSVQ